MMAGEVNVRLAELGADAERHAELARLLRDELLHLDVEDVRPLRTGSAPPGARGVDVADVGGLLIALGQSANGLRAVIATISSWLSRGDASRSVRLELDGDVLEISRASRSDETRLVDLFVQRHTAEVGGAWTASERP